MTDIVTETAEVPEAGPEGQPDVNAGLVEARDRYRTERDSAREELTAAAARIEQLQRAEIERLADKLAEPADLFTLGGVTVADLRDADGNVDPELVSKAVAGVLDTRPGLRRTRAVDPTQGQGGGGVARRALTWGPLLKH